MGNIVAGKQVRLHLGGMARQRYCLTKLSAKKVSLTCTVCAVRYRCDGHFPAESLHKSRLRFYKSRIRFHKSGTCFYKSPSCETKSGSCPCKLRICDGKPVFCEDKSARCAQHFPVTL